MMDYNDKIFLPVYNTENGEVEADTVFHYKQEGRVLTSAYAGGNIIKGHLIGLVDDNGCIDLRYHQVNKKGELMTGHCQSVPEMLPNGKIRPHENWQWTSGDGSKGQSIIEEQ